jgi:tetratricopeptide (TPR) repeat protein
VADRVRVDDALILLALSIGKSYNLAMRMRGSRRPICPHLKIANICLICMTSALLCVSAQPQKQLNDAELKRIVSEARIQTNLVKDDTSRLILLEYLAATEAAFGDIQGSLAEAERLAPLVKEPPMFGNCDDLYLSISGAQLRAGDLEGAMRTAQRANDKKSLAYSLAENFAKNGMTELAAEVAEQQKQSPFPRDRTKIFLEIAVITAKLGDAKRAAELFDRAEAASADLLRVDGARPGVVDLALDVAVSRRLCGNPEAASRMFKESRQVILGVQDESRRQQFMFEFTSAAAKAGEFDLAREVFQEITDPMRKSQAGQGIVHGYLDNGINDSKTAFAIAAQIEDEQEHVSALTDIAMMQARSGDTAGSWKTIGMCEDLLTNITADWKMYSTIGLAAVAYELGDRKVGDGLCDKAISLSERLTIHPERNRTMALESIAEMREERGDFVGALRMAMLDSDARMLRELAETEAYKGNADSALKWIAKLKDPYHKASSLLAVVSGELGREQNTREPRNSAIPRCK